MQLFKSILAFLVFCIPTSVQAASVVDCDKQPVPILNVGLPDTRRLSAAELQGMGASAESLFKEIVSNNLPCNGYRTIQINITLGNDYQVLDWFEKGLIDVAVVPEISLYLLMQNGAGPLEIDLEGNGIITSLVPQKSYLLSSFRAGRPQDPSGSDADFEDFLNNLWRDSAKGRGKGMHGYSSGDACLQKPTAKSFKNFRITLASHLSTGGFLLPVADTVRWLAKRLSASRVPAASEDSLRVVNNFWDLFFEHARFKIDEDMEDNNKEAGLIDLVAAPNASSSSRKEYRDHLVIARRLVNSTLNWKTILPKPRFLSDLDTILGQKPMPLAIAPLLSREPYFGIRTLNFTLEESIALLRQHQKTSGRTKLALVLPGGGVKAVYQSKIVEELYQRRYLRNRLAMPGNTTTEERALNVDFVVGTSGGAMLGYFVAQLNRNGPWNLSNILWTNANGETLDSKDIFGWFDLPGYFSVLVIVFIFAIWLTMLSVVTPSFRNSASSLQAAWRMQMDFVLWPLLALMPFVFRWVNGMQSQEHIPAICSLSYLICVVMAISSDQCLTISKKNEKRTRRMSRSGWCLLPGALVISAALLTSRVSGKHGRWIDWGEPWPKPSVEALCAGLILFFIGIIVWLARSYRFELFSDFVSGFLLNGFLVFSVYFILRVAARLHLGLISLFPLSPGFWMWLIMSSALLGAIVVILGFTAQEKWLGKYLFRGLTFLCARHPNSFFINHRYLRIAGIMFFSFFWWNLVLAPAIYGNQHALSFLDMTAKRFRDEYRKRHQLENPRLATQLLVAANVLERDGTRFFLIIPDDLEFCSSVSANPGSGGGWYTYRVRPESGENPLNPQGCLNFSEKSSREVEQVVFASGSPFPLFPAHLVDLSDRSGTLGNSALVDGGYSNNEPVDAALSVSAEQVLMIESTNPLRTVDPKFDSRTTMRAFSPLGPLVSGLLRLPGFLFERSQQVDRLSRKGLLVVALAPFRDEVNWPSLFDFRREVVERLRCVASRDLSRRIGFVESWGLPRYPLSVLLSLSGKMVGLVEVLGKVHQHVNILEF
jgi:predicted acylesterase/phospholipase RssA